jgi:hypothetical protein
MKFNPKQFLSEGSGPAGGYLGYASDAEVNTGTQYQGMSDPKQSTGAFGSVFQNKATFRPMKSMDQIQLDQIHAAIFSYLSGCFLDPRQALYNLKVKLNHMGLDFDFNRNTPINDGQMSLVLSRYGQKFGTTPTTDLRQGFDRGQDYTNVALSFKITRDPSGQYSFTNINLGNASAPTAEQYEPANKPMQAESFYHYIGSDDYISEKVFKPILLNLVEKVQNETLTESDIQTQLSFIVERAAKRLNMTLSEQDVIHLTEGMFKILFEENEPITKQNQGKKSSAKTTLDKIRMMKKQGK